MEVGLTRSRVVETLYVFLIIGLAGVAFGVATLLLDSDPRDDPSAAARAWGLVALFSTPPGVWLFLASILCSITVRVSDNDVEQVLWRRWVLKRQPLSALTRITGSGFSAMVLHFRGGVKMALPGIHASDRYHFLQFLDERRPDLGLLD